MTQGLFDAFYLPPDVERDAETSVQRFGPPDSSKNNLLSLFIG